MALVSEDRDDDLESVVTLSECEFILRRKNIPASVVDKNMRIMINSHWFLICCVTEKDFFFFFFYYLELSLVF